MAAGLSIAVLVPCYNEQATVTQVVEDFKNALPQAEVYVYDNRSTDETAARALAAGAIVRREEMPGKGHVVRRMFADVEADIYILVDGDATYEAAKAPEMVQKLVSEELDMVVGARIPVDAKAAYRPGHQWGNKMLTGTVAMIFGTRFRDMLSGYRVFSRRFVKSFPTISTGFEIETELNVHALQMHVPAAEVDTAYFERPEDSHSKLNTWQDGFRILWTIAILFKENKPFPFFGLISVFLAILSISFAIPLLITFLETGLVPRLPTAVLSTGLMSVAFLSLVCGIILDSVSRGRMELKRLIYLSYKGVSGGADKL